MSKGRRSRRQRVGGGGVAFRGGCSTYSNANGFRSGSFPFLPPSLILVTCWFLSCMQQSEKQLTLF